MNGPMWVIGGVGLLPLALIVYQEWKRRSDERRLFPKKVASSLVDIKPKKMWCYVTFRDAQRRFIGAMIVEAESELKAFNVVSDRQLVPEGGRVAYTYEIPLRNGVPPEQYRYRLLTSEEVLQLWPDAAKEKH